MSAVNSVDDVGFRAIFEALPDAYLIVSPGAPFTIIAVSKAYLSVTNTIREQIVGRPLFEVFPDDPNEPAATGVKNLTESLNFVLHEKKMHNMAVQKYNIPRPEGGEFEERYWNPRNSPVIDTTGNVVCIIHNVVDVTEQAKLQLSYSELEQKFSEANSKLIVKVKEMGDLNRELIAREARMVELKSENLRLKDEVSHQTHSE